MADDNQRLNFITRIDNAQLKSDAEEAKKAITGIGDKAVADSSRIDKAYKRIAAAAAAAFTIAAAKSFVQEIVRVRSEIQALEVSFGVLLGSKEKADAMLMDIRKYAATTPMGLKDLAQGAQTLLSFNIAGEKVMPILKQLGDISMGNSDRFKSLTLAFSQMSSTGKLMGQDLLQMINAGFNPLTIIAEKTGKSIAQLKKEMEEGVVTSEMVADAFKSATSEGGKFYGMLEKQGQTLNGRISNMKDAWESYLNSLGEKSEGVFAKTIGFITKFIEDLDMSAKSVKQIYEDVANVTGVSQSEFGDTEIKVMAQSLMKNGMKETDAITKAYELHRKDLESAINRELKEIEPIQIRYDELIQYQTHGTLTKKGKEELKAVTEQLRQVKRQYDSLQAELKGVDSKYNPSESEIPDVSKSIEYYEKLIAQLKAAQKQAATRSAFNEIQRQIEEHERAIAEITGKTGYQAERDLQDNLLNLKKQNAKSLLDLQQDNLQKRLSLIDFEHQSELDKIKEFQQKVIDQYNKDNAGNKVTSVSQIDPGLAKQYEEEISRINQFYSDKKVKIQQQAADEIRSIMGGVSEAFLSDQMLEVKAVQDKYKKIREELQKQGNLNKQQENIIKLAEDSELSKKLADIPKQMMEEVFNDFDLSFTNLDSATIGQLKQVADKIRAIQLDKQPLLDAGITEEQIKRLEIALDGLKSEATDNVNTAKLSEYNDIFGEIGGMMQQASDEFVQAIGKMVSAISDSLSTLMDKNASGFQKVTGIISLAITVGNELAKIRRDDMNEAAEKQMEINKALADQITLEASISRMRRDRADQDRNSSAILKPTYGEDIKDAIGDAQEAQKLMDDALGSLFNNAVFSAKGKAKRRLFGSKSGTYSFSMADIFGGNSGTYGSEWGDIFGAGIGRGIQNGDAKQVAGAFLDPLQIFGGYADDKAKGNAFKNLQSAFDKTFEAMGKKSSDIAQMTSQDWVDFYSLMDEMGYVTDEGTKEMINQAKAASEEYAKAMEDLKATISDMAGTLGDTLSSSLVDAFKNGEDAALALEKTVSGVIESIISQMIFNATFGNRIKQMEEEIVASMDIGGDQNMIDDITRFYKDAGGSLEMYNNAMEAARAEAEKTGLNIFQGEEAGRQAVAKGLSAAMTQDSADRLDGLFTSVQGHTYSIQNDLKILVTNNAAMLRHLSGIEVNTQNLTRLTKIESDIASMRSGIDTMTLKGLKIYSA